MPTWVQVKTTEGSKLVLKENRPRKQVHHIMVDIEPYQATAGDVTGKYITSRSREREYLKRNNCIQVGNEWNHFSEFNGKDHNNTTRHWGRED